MRYIAVIHGWHVSSNGFNVYELEVKTEEEAYKEAKIICHDRQATFDNCAFKVIKIEDNERLNKIPNWVKWLFGQK